MVRRGSTVRVRQRAPAKAPQTRGFHSLGPLHVVQRDQIWNTFWNTQTKTGALLSSSLTTDERPPTCPVGGELLEARGRRELAQAVRRWEVDLAAEVPARGTGAAR